MPQTNIWKPKEAKARFSEVVRRARAGQPQQVTIRGKQGVVIVDPTRFEIRPKPPQEPTLAGFIERSKKYRGATEGVEFRGRFKMKFRDKRWEIFDAPRNDKVHRSDPK
jgi:prevent-host-death family protein